MLLIRNLAAEYERLYTTPAWVIGMGVGIPALILAYAVNYYAGWNASLNAYGQPSIGDVLLDAVPRIDTMSFHLVVVPILTLFTMIVVFFVPRYFPFALISVAACSLVRSLFINMTYLGVYVDMPFVQTATMFPGSLFFSGHVAFSFILVLVFWNQSILRYVFLACSLVLAVEVIIGHHHYTIDVAVAPFIAFGLYSAIRRLAPSLAALSEGKPASFSV